MMDRFVGQVQAEWVVAIFRDELERVIGQLLGYVWLARRRLDTVDYERTVEVSPLPPLHGERDELIDPPQFGKPAWHVPFADEGRVIPDAL